MEAGSWKHRNNHSKTQLVLVGNVRILLLGSEKWVGWGGGVTGLHVNGLVINRQDNPFSTASVLKKIHEELQIYRLKPRFNIDANRTEVIDYNSEAGDCKSRFALTPPSRRMVVAIVSCSKIS
ncbi:hypothetical protein J6590_001336 [Homalodisca vitripennis]|nr:hypothetical protein J6590_001336 [Homalodisca vitripennis]